MITVQVIASFHKEIGKFTHEKLFEILNALSPDIIFEELDSDTYNIIYKEENAHTLEPKAILKYLKTNNIPHKPVDTFFLSDIDVYEYNEVIRVIDRYDIRYRKLAEKQLRMTINGGFSFLNSTENNEMIISLQQMEVDVINKIKNLKYQRLYEKWKNNTIHRERTFITNIVDTLQSEQFLSAVFITGAEHKFSIENNFNLNVEFPNIKWLFGL